MPGPKQPSRVIFDTNVWVSFLIGKQLQRLRPLLARQVLKLVVAPELLEELAEVVQRPKLARYFSPEKAHDLLQYLRISGLPVSITSEVHLCRDPKDNFLLALAQDAKADFLVTGDQDLLVLDPFGQTRILTPAAFDARFRAV